MKTLTEDDFEHAGKLCNNLSFTQEELQLVHDATQCVLTYMKARDDAGLSATPTGTQANLNVVLFSLRALEWLELTGINWHPSDNVQPASDLQTYLDLRWSNITEVTKELLNLDTPPAPQLARSTWELQYLRAKMKWLETKKEHKCQDTECKKCDPSWIKFCKVSTNKYD